MNPRTPRGATPGLVPALIAVLLFALALRVPGVFATMYENRDELNYVPKAVRFGGGDLNPHYFHNPPLASYLFFAGVGVRFAAGWIAGTFASPADFKASFVLDGAGAFEAARAVSLVLGLANVAAVAVLALRLLPSDASSRSRRVAAIVAALALAAAPLHVERSAAATNEALVTLATTLAAIAALRLVRDGTARSAVLAGALAGVAAASKYTGVLACVAAGLAALLAPSASAGARLRLLGIAAGSAIAAFVVACPWAVLDAATFRAHVLDQASLEDRWVDGEGWKRYLEVAWTTGLGPVASVLAVLGVAVAAVGAARGPREVRATHVVALAAALALTIFLFAQTRLAYGRYLLPVYPVYVALGAAALGAWDRGWLRGVRAAGFASVAVWAALQVPPALARATVANAEDTRDRAAAWVRDHVPDGARVVTDWWAPRLPRIEDRREFEASVSPAVAARFRPAFRVRQGFDYFALPVNAAPDATVRVDDFPGLRTLGEVWFVVSDLGPATLAKLPPGERPAARWYEGLARETELVHAERPEPGVLGPTIEVRVLR